MRILTNPACPPDAFFLVGDDGAVFKQTFSCAAAPPTPTLEEVAETVRQLELEQEARRETFRRALARIPDPAERLQLEAVGAVLFEGARVVLKRILEPDCIAFLRPRTVLCGELAYPQFLALLRSVAKRAGVPLPEDPCPA